MVKIKTYKIISKDRLKSFMYHTYVSKVQIFEKLKIHLHNSIEKPKMYF